MKKNIQNCILIIDFGSQYAQLIARRVRELGIYCEIFLWDNISESNISLLKPKGIILSGSPESSIKKNSPYIKNYIFQLGIPILGICYGMQVMVVQLGGEVQRSSECEFGHAQVEIKNHNILVNDIKDSINQDNGKNLINVWMSHTDKVTAMPPNFTVIGSTTTCPFAIIANVKNQFYGVQFHPEVTHTKQGLLIIRRFVCDICKCIPLWSTKIIMEEIIINIRKQVGRDKVILGISGGVDSSVTAILLQRAIGDQLTCVFINNGFLRLNEVEQVLEMFNNRFKIKIIYIPAEQRFLDALLNITEPEKKRKIIGHVFVEIFNEVSEKLINVKWLAQGTIYPDIIESATLNRNAHTIKSHHNVGGLPRKMKLKLLEPLKSLFKDEVRKVGLKLDLPYSMLYRHPFPGPGLAVRILGEVKKEYCDLLRKTDAIFIEELYKKKLYYKVSQAFSVFLPIRSVGVMGDSRTYEWVIALRAVETIDFMTAKWAYLPHDFLAHVSNRIINEINGISRVVYDISSKPPSTIEWL